VKLSSLERQATKQVEIDSRWATWIESKHFSQTTTVQPFNNSNNKVPSPAKQISPQYDSYLYVRRTKTSVPPQHNRCVPFEGGGIPFRTAAPAQPISTSSSRNHQGHLGLCIACWRRSLEVTARVLRAKIVVTAGCQSKGCVGVLAPVKAQCSSDAFQCHFVSIPSLHMRML
jgi:hypothetical protein